MNTSLEKMLLNFLSNSQQQNGSQKPAPTSTGQVTEDISFRYFTNGKEPRIGFGNTNPKDPSNPRWTLAVRFLPQLIEAACTAIESFGSPQNQKEGAESARAAFERLSGGVLGAYQSPANGVDTSGQVYDLRS